MVGYPGLDGVHSYHQDLYVGETHKRRCRECRLISRPTTDCSHYFRIQCSHFWDTQEHGMLCFLFRSTVCQVDWLQVMPAFSLTIHPYTHRKVYLCPLIKEVSFYNSWRLLQRPATIKRQKLRDWWVPSPIWCFYNVTYTLKAQGKSQKKEHRIFKSYRNLLFDNVPKTWQENVSIKSQQWKRP